MSNSKLERLMKISFPVAHPNFEDHWKKIRKLSAHNDDACNSIKLKFKLAKLYIYRLNSNYSENRNITKEWINVNGQKDYQD